MYIQPACTAVPWCFTCSTTSGFTSSATYGPICGRAFNSFGRISGSSSFACVSATFLAHPRTTRAKLHEPPPSSTSNLAPSSWRRSDASRMQHFAIPLRPHVKRCATYRNGDDQLGYGGVQFSGSQTPTLQASSRFEQSIACAGVHEPDWQVSPVCRLDCRRIGRNPDRINRKQASMHAHVKDRGGPSTRLADPMRFQPRVDHGSKRAGTFPPACKHIPCSQREFVRTRPITPSIPQCTCE